MGQALSRRVGPDAVQCLQTRQSAAALLPSCRPEAPLPRCPSLGSALTQESLPYPGRLLLGECGVVCHHRAEGESQSGAGRASNQDASVTRNV